MKIVTPLTLICLLGFASLKAQVSFKKGTHSINGSLAYYQSSNETSVNNSTNPSSSGSKTIISTLSAERGHFIKDNLSLTIGVNGNYTMSEVSNSYLNNVIGGIQNSKNSNTTLEGQLGIGLTKYYPIGQSNFAFLIVTNIRGGMGRNYQSQLNSNRTDNQTTYNTFSGFVYVAPQILYLITPKWGLTAGIGGLSYKYTKTFSLGNDDYEGTSSSLNSSLSINSLSLGMTYFINH